jgi:SAM-dependent methyltransferase
MRRLRRIKRRLAQAVYREWRPDFRLIDNTIKKVLGNRLAAEDSPHKSAVVIGSSAELAHELGLRRARLLVLDFPQFTIENLALLSDSYDFVIADRALHRCESIDDAACETIRVLRPGGWFVHTTCLFDQTLGVPIQWRRIGPGGLARLFSGGESLVQGHAAGRTVSWIIGRKAAPSPEVTPTVATRRAARRRYPGPPSPEPARFGVVAIARNEAPYLLEWIAHYRVLGFERITIYDNESNDASWRILAPLSKAGVIEAIYWRNRRKQHKQQSAYNHARLRQRDSLEWCLIVDLDEFLVLKEGLALDDIVPRDPAISALTIPWRVFGSSGQRHRETGLTIERFRRAGADNASASKSLVRLRDVTWMGTHWPTLSRGRMVDIAGNDFDPSQDAKRIADGPARLHHYFGRSWEEFECKRARGRGTGPKGAMRPQSIFDSMDANDIMLDDALRLAAATKEEIARLMKIVKA